MVRVPSTYSTCELTTVKTRGTSATALTKKQTKPHSAAHTLAFIENEYVEIDDDAEHFTWSDIMTATRQTRMSLFAWVDSFTIMLG
jgi:hypothetical protein